jgi:tRNA(fMet)-specific endonuclease VapC
MLDTCICSFIMREHPQCVLERLAAAVQQNHRIVISAITYSEMRFWQIGKKAAPKHKLLVDEFVRRVDAVLPRDHQAVDAAIEVRLKLAELGTPIASNDAAIAGHAISQGYTVITNSTREFSRVDGLVYEDWVH